MGKNLVIVLLVLAVGGLSYLVWKPALAPTIPKTEVVEEKNDVMCAQVITPARDPKTGAITEFPTPCDVPKGWELIENDVPGLDLEVQ